MTAPRAIITLTPELLQRFYGYSQKVGDEWGSLHVVLADGNFKDADVRCCIDYAHKHNDVEGEILGGILLQLSESQRGRVAYKSARVMK